MKITSRSTEVLAAAGLLKPRKVFSWCHYESMDAAETTLSGSAFQISASATGKAQLPVVVA